MISQLVPVEELDKIEIVFGIMRDLYCLNSSLIWCYDLLACDRVFDITVSLRSLLVQKVCPCVFVCLCVSMYMSL